MFDDIGNIIKDNFENRARIYLPRRTFTIIRVDGRAFSSYTSQMDKPFDPHFMKSMALTAEALCRGISGTVFAYVQSDEISLLLTDFETIQKQPMFDGNLQKLCSISASIATAEFNALQWKKLIEDDLLDIKGPPTQANFDSRVFTIPSREYVMQYFQWRQADAIRNSISMAARHHFSHKQLDGKSTRLMREMLLDKGIDWAKYPANAQRGQMVVKKTSEKEVEYTIHGELKKEKVMRSSWEAIDPMNFTKEQEQFINLIPDFPKIGASNASAD